MDVNGISDELIEKACACKSVEDLVALAREEGFELSDEALEAVSGGIGRIEPASLSSCRDNRIRLALADSLASCRNYERDLFATRPLV